MSVHPPPEPEVAGLPEGATGPVHRPYVADSAVMPELTWSAVTLGAILGIIFGASSLYLVLKVGMTVSASIPVAVLSITLFRFFAKATGTRPATILENNIVQTTGSAGESIAFGVGVTMPALMILGYDMRATQVMLVAALGGLLGILMMIPLRRAFIVKQHGSLTYPEGTACAKVLIVGEQGGSSAKTVFTGFGMAFVYQVLMEGLKLWNQYPARAFQGFKGAVLTCDVSPVLLGVGYIIGPRIASVTFAGGVLAYLVLTPTIVLFGQGTVAPIFPGTKPIADMSPKDIRDAYMLYIGAGAVAAGGLISLLQALPLILSSIRSGLGDLARSNQGNGFSTGRTERDLPLWIVGAGSTALVVAIAATGLFPTKVEATGRVVGALMIAVFGFLFVTVSSRLTGEIGSSSNPISGMTVATLLLTCLVFVLMGWIGTEYRVAALSIAGIVCVAASNGGTTSQDLKTGFLVGATPRSQQIAIVVGALTSAIVIGFTLLLLNEASTVVTGKAENLPTATAKVAELTDTEPGPDGKPYKVWWVVDAVPGAQPGKYLVDDSGQARYLIDPAINGRVEARDDGTKVTRYEAPKARLMALIIDGIMKGELPWGLVILGALIAGLMHLCGAPALAFAVGVYLPLSTSMPIFVGGLVRVAVDRIKRTRPEDSDSSPAVLLSSGYIAGGAIAGILIALLALAPSDISNALDLSRQFPKSWNEGAWPSLGAFGLMVVVLLLCGLGVFFKGADPKGAEKGVTGREEDL
jgi:putative OPT family oligopeptide transporter